MNSAVVHDEFDSVLGPRRGRPDIDARLRADARDEQWRRVPALLLRGERRDLERLVALAVETGLDTAPGSGLAHQLAEAALGAAARTYATATVRTGMAFLPESGGKLAAQTVAILDKTGAAARVRNSFLTAPTLDGPTADDLTEAAAKMWRDTFIGVACVEITADPMEALLDMSARGDNASIANAAPLAVANIYDQLVEHPTWTESDVDKLNTALFAKTRCRLTSRLPSDNRP